MTVATLDRRSGGRMLLSAPGPKAPRWLAGAHPSRLHELVDAANRALAPGRPTRVGTSLSDLVAGVFMFCGIASALYAREKTGKGAHVDVAMFDSTFAFLEHGIMESLATGEAPRRIGNRHLTAATRNSPLVAT
jgi:hypothetical protein